MIPINNLGETFTPDGSRFSLHERQGSYSIMFNGMQLMSTDWTVSELALADEALKLKGKNRKDKPRVLIGGLGLGFSLRRVLEIVGPGAHVCQAELLPEVVQWNRDFLMKVNGVRLNDPRVEIYIGDVYQAMIDGGKSCYDAILLDVDNGPTAFVQPANARLYSEKGLGIIRDALTPGGRVSFWAATEEKAFPKQLRRAGFKVEEVAAKMHERAKRAAHRIYTGEKN